MAMVILGGNGQLGRALGKCFPRAHRLDRPDSDLLRPQDLLQRLDLLKPSIILNAAAFTQVDPAEDREAEAFAANAEAPEKLAFYCRERKIPWVHYSTDYVFDGTLNRPYCESDTPNPINVYGESKWAGEQAIARVGGPYLILRTAWLFSGGQNDFIGKVIERGRNQSQLEVVADQLGSPSFTEDVAESTKHFVDLLLAGRIQEQRTYHIVNSGVVSRFDLAAKTFEVLEQLGWAPRKLVPVPSSYFASKAQRPQFSALSCERARQEFAIELRPWQQALAALLNQQFGRVYEGSGLRASGLEAN